MWIALDYIHKKDVLNPTTERSKMLDTLALTLALLSAPVPRPNMERNVRIVAPVQVASIQLARKDERASNNLTTCYENEQGSCWGKE